MVVRDTLRRLGRLILLILLALPFSRAQEPARPPAPPPEPPVAQVPAGYVIQSDVGLVLLHVSVVDAHGQFFPGLQAEDFRVFEDNTAQKIAVFREEDAPVSMGLLVDNSASMEEKRAGVNAAALTFVKTSNPDDEVFVAHFNDKYSFDLNKEFTSDVGELRTALEHTESRGPTALYDAILTSLDHLKSGYNSKKVLLIVSDGEDNSSRNDLHLTLERAQRSNAMIYAVGLLGQEQKDSAERARQALISLTQATGGSAFFPSGVQQVEAICTQFAYDIRHQYTLAYYPANAGPGRSFRAIRVEVVPPPGAEKLSVRTRTGYFATQTASSN